MAKPPRIKSSAIGVKGNDIQFHRLQAVGATGNLNPEQIKEIGNAEIVEVLDGIPTVDVTLDRNQDGSIRPLAAFANKNFNYGYVQVKPSGTSSKSVLVDRDDWFYNEMKYSFSGTQAYDLTSYISAVASEMRIVVLSLPTSGNTVTVTSGTASTTAPTRPTTPTDQLKIAEVYLINGMASIQEKNILNCHDYLTIYGRDFENADIDVVLAIKETGDNDTTDPITRSMYLENVYLNRLDFAVNTGGVSTENLAGETDNKKHFLTTKRSVADERFKGTGSTPTFTLATDPTTLNNGKKMLKVRVYDSSTGLYADKTEGAGLDFTVSGKVITFLANPTATQSIIARYTHSGDVTASFKRLPNPDSAHPSPAGALRQGNIEIFLSDDATNKVLRIESCTVSLGLTREALPEVGSERPFARPLTLPIPVTITLNTTASDLAEFARLCGTTNLLASELSFSDFIKTLGMNIYMYRESDVKRADFPWKLEPYMKKLAISEISITNEGFDSRVDANATQTFTFTADNVTIQACI